MQTHLTLTQMQLKLDLINMEIQFVFMHLVMIFQLGVVFTLTDSDLSMQTLVQRNVHSMVDLLVRSQL